jgi:hypothetical protein
MKVFIKYFKVFINKLYCRLVNIRIKLNIYLNKYYAIYILGFTLAILVFLLELLYSGNVIYCDSFDNDLIRLIEGDSPFPSDDVEHRAINEFDDRVINELDSRPITYQPYHPGLQSTNQGYRFELSGSSRRLPAELEGDNISSSRGLHSLRTYGPSAYNPNYKPNSNSTPRVMVDDYYGIRSNQSIRTGVNNRVDINPLDSEFYKDRYATNPFHDDTYHAAGESTCKKAKHSFKKFVDWAKDDFAKSRAKSIKALDRRIAEDAKWSKSLNKAKIAKQLKDLDRLKRGLRK